VTRIEIAADEARALLAVCRRQLSWDPRMAARLVTAERALGVYTAPPLDVLVFTAVPATVDGEASDIVVALTTLTTALEQCADAGAPLDLAALSPVSVPVTSDISVAVLPPADNWQMPMHAVASDLTVRVDGAVAEFERRAAGQPTRQQEIIAKEIWEATPWAGVPMRTLHAARKLGMLGVEPVKVSAATNGDWRRLSTRRGQVFAKVSPRLPLSVVR
jgi:hypothetical protein